METAPSVGLHDLTTLKISAKDAFIYESISRLIRMNNDFLSTCRLIKEFSEKRNWDQFHSPKNLLLALVSEVGELSEVFLWKSDEELAEFLKVKNGRNKISEETLRPTHFNFGYPNHLRRVQFLPLYVFSKLPLMQK